MEYYSATRNNDMGFEGKWMQLEDIMLNEVSQNQKHKRCIFSLIPGRSKDKHIYKTSMITFNVCNSGVALWNSGKEGNEKRMIKHQ
jgi:hypothetical protein